VHTLQPTVDLPGLELVRLLGRGKVADVFLAREPDLGRLVAVKVLRAELASDPAARQRFEREAQGAASLIHPGVVQVHRVGSTGDGRPFLVMQYIQGRSLEERLRGNGPPEAAEARRIVREVADALDAIHRHRVVHCDVRLDNVLQDAETGRVLLTDFGLAAMLEAGDRPLPRRDGPGPASDARFTSPEQARGERPTEKSDVYQLGVVAWYVLTGEGPPRATGAGEQPDLGRDRAGLDPLLADVVRRCLAPEPRDRPTAGDVARRLAAAPAAPDAQHPSLGLLHRRIPQFVGGSAVLGLGVMTFVSELIQNGLLGQIFYPLSIVLAIHLVLGTSVVAWFHGARGRQQVQVPEVALLAALCLTWLAASAWIVAR
jgi:serine/threonine-protein kinase